MGLLDAILGGSTTGQGVPVTPDVSNALLGGTGLNQPIQQPQMQPNLAQMLSQAQPQAAPVQPQQSLGGLAAAAAQPTQAAAQTNLPPSVAKTINDIDADTMRKAMMMKAMGRDDLANEILGPYGAGKEKNTLGSWMDTLTGKQNDNLTGLQSGVQMAMPILMGLWKQYQYNNMLRNAPGQLQSAANDSLANMRQQFQRT